MADRKMSSMHGLTGKDGVHGREWGTRARMGYTGKDRGTRRDYVCFLPRMALAQTDRVGGSEP